jgi:hypothetical protein
MQESGDDFPACRAFRDSQRQLQDARATTDAGLADQPADGSRALLLDAPDAVAAAAWPLRMGKQQRRGYGSGSLLILPSAMTR